MNLLRQLIVSSMRKWNPSGPPTQEELDSVDNLLVVRAHDQLGDFMLVGPAFQALRQRFPKAFITLATNKFLAPLARHHPDFDRVVIAPWDRSPKHYGELRAVIKRLREREYDLAVVVNTISHSLTADLLARLSRPFKIVGPSRPLLKDFRDSPLYDWAYEPAKPATPHQFDVALSVVAPLGATVAEPSYRYGILGAERQEAQRLRARLPLGRLIALHLGTKDPKKRYPTGLWVQAAKRVADETGAHLVLCPAPDAQEAGAHVAAALGDRITVLSPLSLRALTALFAELSLVLCHDSAILHLAASVGTSTVSIHGRGDAANWKPRGERHVALQASDHQTASVRPEEVAGAVKSVWQLDRERHAALRPVADRRSA